MSEKAQVANRAEIWSVWANNHCQNELEVFESHGMGLRAPRSFKEGDVLLRVPSSLAITSSTSINDEMASWLLNCSGDGPHLLHRVVVYLALHQTQWTPYFKLLPSPQDLSLPFTWNAEDDDELLGTSIGDATVTKRRYVDAMFRTTQPIEGMTPALWYLAYEWIASRSLEQPQTGQHVLVPFLDLVNHSEDANSRYDFDGKDYLLFATKDIEKGQQVFIDYGVRSAGEFLFKYGFVPSTPDETIIRTYDPMNEDIRKIIDVSRDPDVPDEETRQMLAAAYAILLQFVGCASFEIRGNAWKDKLLVLLACEDLVELKCVDGVYDLYIGDEPIDPLKIQELCIKYPEVGERAQELAKQLVQYFISVLPKTPGERTRALVEHEHHVYSRI